MRMTVARKANKDQENFELNTLMNHGLQKTSIYRRLSSPLLQEKLFGTAQLPGTKLVANAQALLFTGSARWSARFSRGPLPVTMACTKKPNMENMASRPFFSSFTFSSANASGSSADPAGRSCRPGTGGRLPRPAARRRRGSPRRRP